MPKEARPSGFFTIERFMFKMLEIYAELQDLRSLDLNEDEIEGYLQMFLEKFELNDDQETIH